jgi:hypothetical protein
MKIKTLTAPIALAAVLGFGPAAFAQNMVGTQQVTEADMAAVAEHCRTLAMGSDDQAAGATAAGGDAGNSGNADNDSVSSTGGPDADAGTMDGAQPTTAQPERHCINRRSRQRHDWRGRQPGCGPVLWYHQHGGHHPGRLPSCRDVKQTCI